MKYFTNIFVAAVMVGLGMGSMQVGAAPIQYTINNYPGEFEATVSGTITADDNGNGNLLAAEITDWQISVTGHPTYPDVSFGTSTQTNTLEQIWGNPRVSATEISILSWTPAADKGDLVLTGTSDTGVVSKMTWTRDAAWGEDNSGIIFISDGNTYWERRGGGTLGGNEIWTVASGGVSLAPPDADGDGVADDADQCADTPDGEAVDANGCSDSQKDSDNDGVSDADDQCAGTPDGEAVDGNGCSDSQRDSDNDGVADNADNCADTPAGAAVDANGCDAFALIAAIALTPGEQGAQGKAGADGADGADAPCVNCQDVATSAVDLACAILGVNPPSSVQDIRATADAIKNSLLISANICDAGNCDVSSEINAAIDAKLAE